MTIIAWVSIAGGCLSAGAVLYDIYIRGLRQPMRVMEAVWPLTAVYLGALGWLVYTRLGRPEVRDDVAEVSEQDVPEWQGVAVSATHCGAGCALGDVIGEGVVFGTSLTIAGAALWPEYILDFAIAYTLGILFQYFAIKPMSDLSTRAVLGRAVRADTLSLVAFEAGMFAWMALVFFVIFPYPHLQADHAAYWLMMQIAMALGLLTTYPVNIWLVRQGVKHPMGRPVLPRPEPGVRVTGHGSARR